MKRRQTIPRQWLIVNQAPDPALWHALRRLPVGSGVLLIHALRSEDRRRLRRFAHRRRLEVIAESSGAAVRIHNAGELTRALLRRPMLVLISPLYATRSHPDWAPLQRMRAATLAMMTNRKAVALGGMDERRFRRVRRLGFIAWAGISAFRT